jgi:purine-binding chemotaxis protein CheW
VLRERARELAQSLPEDDPAGCERVAVVRLGKEFFALELELVREFTAIRHVTPVPCCPKHIVGQMNLRGDIVTLVDLRPLLHVPASASLPPQLALLELQDIVFGVPVDEVVEILTLRLAETESLPAPSAGRDTFLKGAAPYCGRMLGVLDVSRILTEGHLVVSENVSGQPLKLHGRSTAGRDLR